MGIELYEGRELTRHQRPMVWVQSAKPWSRTTDVEGRPFPISPSEVTLVGCAAVGDRPGRVGLVW